MNIGEIIRKERIKRNMTQNELGNLISLTNTAISNYESGKTLPSIDILVLIADCFGLSLDKLVGRNDIPPDSSMTMLTHVKSLNFQSLNAKENIYDTSLISKTLIKTNSYVYQMPDDTYYDSGIKRAEYIVFTTETNPSNGDLIIYTEGKSNDVKIGIFNISGTKVIITNTRGKAKLFEQKNVLKIKAVITHKFSRLK